MAAIKNIFNVHVLVHMSKYVQDIKFQESKLRPGYLPTDNNTNVDDTNDDDNTRQIIHNYIGSLAFMSNEPKRE